MTPVDHVLFVFLDGVGIGPGDEERNPFLRARLPTLARLVGRRLPTLDGPEAVGERAVVFPLDALLDVEGLPQSGTGQTSLLTGRNAALLFGRHFGPWTPVRLRPLLERESLFAAAREAGITAAFANAYPENYPRSRRSRFMAAPPLAASSAGLLNRHRRELVRGDAVASEIVNAGWRGHLGFRDVPRLTPEEAGRNLAGIARSCRLTFYAHYGTDTVGHEGDMERAVEALERVDRFLDGVLTGLPPGARLLVASDHGNVEDVSEQHTRNPALGIVAGPEARAAREGLGSITDLRDAVLEWLGGAS